MKDIAFNVNTKPINIPEKNEIIQDNINISVAGWGAIEVMI
jgi:hypothetical protein